MARFIEGSFLMNHQKEATTSFAEVFAATGITTRSARESSPDSRVIVYYHGIKIAVPDNFQPDTLRQLFLILRDL